ncbi:lactate dehydrogenase [Enterovibrio sp. ZSDZ35]|uniref:Lactate dehydrogenase n=1 Tax=Enterovibrio qingdaonensis TaxID=2899818 RepID=A0ABT5QIJ3_9GAMM|nr:lactate dehydrogenase [Enterovibrio sp. ZSDZ35]MDD1780136.1 lactate dehydrogenase [Enterovibrio sp. ZSDZ35]
MNHCKTLACRNFGLSDKKYYLLQVTDPSRPELVCRECGAFPPLLNNSALLEELNRSKEQDSASLAACSNQACPSCNKPVLTHRELYHAFGYSGERQRYRCKHCQSTFVDKWSNANPKLDIQQKLLGLVFTGHAVREICRKLAINPKTFYDHLDQIALRCRNKLATVDARFVQMCNSTPMASTLAPLQPSSKNGVNWLATGDAKHGYVFQQSLNYAADEMPPDDSNDTIAKRSRLMPNAFDTQIEANVATPKDLLERVNTKYSEVLSRKNVEDPYTKPIDVTYPSTGSLIRPQYTTYAHFLRIAESTIDWDSITLYLPQEPLLRSAIVSVFKDRMEERTCHPIYVEQNANWIEPNSSETVDIVLLSWWRDRWAFTKIGVGSKGICHLGRETNNERYWLEKASTEQLEDYQSRFHLCFKSVIDEPRRRRRPGGLLPLLDIYRAWNNLCHQNSDGFTPAQALGLARKPYSLADLLS